jgi:hypothetical protein
MRGTGCSPTAPSRPRCSRAGGSNSPPAKPAP